MLRPKSNEKEHLLADETPQGGYYRPGATGGANENYPNRSSYVPSDYNDQYGEEGKGHSPTLNYMNEGNGNGNNSDAMSITSRGSDDNGKRCMPKWGRGCFPTNGNSEDAHRHAFSPNGGIHYSYVIVLALFFSTVVQLSRGGLLAYEQKKSAEHTAGAGTHPNYTYSMSTHGFNGVRGSNNMHNAAYYGNWGNGKAGGTAGSNNNMNMGAGTNDATGMSTNDQKQTMTQDQGGGILKGLKSKFTQNTMEKTEGSDQQGMQQTMSGKNPSTGMATQGTTESMSQNNMVGNPASQQQNGMQQKAYYPPSNTRSQSAMGNSMMGASSSMGAQGSTGTMMGASSSMGAQGSTGTMMGGSPSMGTQGSTGTMMEGSPSMGTQGSTGTMMGGSPSMGTQGSTGTVMGASSPMGAQGSTGTMMEGSPSMGTQGSTGTMMGGSSMGAQGSTGTMMGGSPSMGAQGSTGTLMGGSPSMGVQGSTGTMMGGSPLMGAQVSTGTMSSNGVMTTPTGMTGMQGTTGYTGAETVPGTSLAVGGTQSSGTSPGVIASGASDTTAASVPEIDLRELANFKDSWDPWEPNDMPVFFHIPKSGGSTIKDVMGTCHRFVMASEAGVTDGHIEDTEIAIVYPRVGVPGASLSPFVNIDATTVEGINRAKTMGFADSGLGDAVVTPFIYEANELFTQTAKGRLFTVFRHPIERAISLFFYLQVADWEPTYDPALKDWTIEQYATSDKIENNWLTRQLSNQLSGDLTEEHVQKALEVIRTKFLVGLMKRMEETMTRLERFFHWTYHVNPANQDICRDDLLNGGSNSNSKNKKDKPKEGDEAWNLLAAQNQYDLQLFGYIETLFDEQEQYVANIPENMRNEGATCCKCGPPTFPPEGFECPAAITEE